MGELSEQVLKRCRSSDAFERSLYEELVERLRVLRVEPVQIKPYTARSWIVPVATVAVIVIVYFAYVFTAF
jgi:hypothetical protein